MSHSDEERDQVLIGALALLTNDDRSRDGPASLGLTGAQARRGDIDTGHGGQGLRFEHIGLSLMRIIGAVGFRQECRNTCGEISHC